MNLIAEKLDVKKDDSKRPFQTVWELLKFRNDVAHGKTISMKSEDELFLTDNELKAYMRKPLEAEWEAYCTLENAKRVREDVETLMLQFHGAAKVDRLLFPPGMSSSLATLIDH